MTLPFSWRIHGKYVICFTYQAFKKFFHMIRKNFEEWQKLIKAFFQQNWWRNGLIPNNHAVFQWFGLHFFIHFAEKSTYKFQQLFKFMSYHALCFVVCWIWNIWLVAMLTADMYAICFMKTCQKRMQISCRSHYYVQNWPWRTRLYITS